MFNSFLKITVDQNCLRPSGEGAILHRRREFALINLATTYTAAYSVSKSKCESAYLCQSLQAFAQLARLRHKNAVAWRWADGCGYCPVGDELTAGKPDWKEGIYFGAELAPTHPPVQQQFPLHSANLFPAIPQFRETVLESLTVMT